MNRTTSQQRMAEQRTRTLEPGADPPQRRRPRPGPGAGPRPNRARHRDARADKPVDRAELSAAWQRALNGPPISAVQHVA